MTLLFAWLSPAGQTEGTIAGLRGQAPVIDFRFFRAIMPIFVFALAFIGGIGTRPGCGEAVRDCGSGIGLISGRGR